jgi:hypothetical protein
MPRASRSDVGDGEPKENFLERLRRAMVKPGVTGAAPVPVKELSIGELEEANRSLNDRERLVGLTIAPIGAAVSFICAHDLTTHDAPHASTYATLELVLVGMCLLMMLFSFLRKRLFLGIVMALFGVGIFNLHYFELGFPFVLAGAWYLVRAYRLSQRLKMAGGNSGMGRWAPPGSSSSAPRPSKRYTPPTSRRRRVAKPKSEDDS